MQMPGLSFNSRSLVTSGGPSAAQAGPPRSKPAAPANDRVARKRRRVCIVGIGNSPCVSRLCLQLALDSLRKRQSVPSAMIFWGWT